MTAPNKKPAGNPGRFTLTGNGDGVYYVDLDEVGDDGAVIIRWALPSIFSAAAAERPLIALAQLADRQLFQRRAAQLSAQSLLRLTDLRDRRLEMLLGSSYEIPATVMARDIELEALARIFETLNRSGIRLNAFDLMVAVLYPSDFKLRDKWEEATAEHEALSAYDADALEILKLIALWERDAILRGERSGNERPITGVRERDVLNLPPATVTRLWPQAVAAYVEALNFLRTECGVYDGSALPSAAMVLTIAYRLSVDGRSALLRRWYWGAIARQDYAQGANTQVVADVGRDFEERGVLFGVREVTAMRVGLADAVRRNRVLRMGLRALVNLEGLRDPYSGEQLTGRLQEVSLPALHQGYVGLKPDDALLDCVHVSISSASALRRLVLRSGPQAGLDALDPALLATHGLGLSASGQTTADPELGDRSATVRLWFEAQVR